MSQNPLVIADGSGATVLNELNQAFDTTMSMNSGPSAPATTYPFMLWADTTTNRLKQRDTSNTTWIVVGVLGADYLGNIAAQFTPHQAAYPNMTVLVDSGRSIKADGTLISQAQQTTAAFTAPVTNPRIDRIVIDQLTGAISVIAGTPAASPTAPAITAGQRPCAQVLLQTTSTSITNSMITEERVSIIQSTYTPPGAILIYAASAVPSGWLGCDGAAVSRTTYSGLFAIIGSTYGGGDGSTTFNLPNLSGRVPVGVGTGSGLTARTLAATGGEENHVLTTAEIPSHQHSIYTEYLGNIALGGTGYLGDNNTSSYLGTPNTGAAGSNGAHNTMPPFLVLNFIIKT